MGPRGFGGCNKAMKGFELAEVREALLGAYNKGAFDMFLKDEFDFVRENEVGAGPFKNVVSDVIELFAQDGRLPFLIAASTKAKPLNAGLAATYEKYGAALVGEVWKSA